MVLPMPSRVCKLELFLKFVIDVPSRIIKGLHSLNEFSISIHLTVFQNQSHAS